MEGNIYTALDEPWISGTEMENGIVISSRIRLARNFAALPFPHMMKDEEKTEWLRQIEKELCTQDASLRLFHLGKMKKIERQILVEKHLISPEHARHADGAVVLNEDRTVSVMLLEEDHLRIQAIVPGFALAQAYKKAEAVDDLFEAHFDIAFNEKYGFLTSCPTNVGTGLRASVMLHLPGLVLTRQANRILSTLTQVGIVVRGIYGEGTEAHGNLFQISNQITIGRTENEIIENLSQVVAKIVDQEKASREMLMREAEPVLLDKVFRAYGILTHARKMTSEEALSLLSDMRMGVDMGILEGINPNLFQKLMICIQPAFLQYSADKEMSAQMRDQKRAEMIRQLLKKE